MTPDSSAPATAEASPAPRTINPAIDVMMEPQRGFNLRQFWHALVERLWIVGLCVLAGLFVALGYLGRTPKTYQSHAVLEVDFQEPTFVAGDDSSVRMRSMFLASQEALRTIEQNLTNRQMLARVIRAEGLADDDGKALLGSARGGAPGEKVTPIPSKGSDRTQPNAVEGMTFTPMENALAGAVSGMVKATISPLALAMPAFRALPRPDFGSFTNTTRKGALSAKLANTSDVASVEPLSTTTSSHSPDN